MSPSAAELPHAGSGLESSAGHFPETRWSVIAGAQATEHAEALSALDQLARAYWKPLYCYLRGTGRDHARAADAVQDFFV